MSTVALRGIVSYDETANEWSWTGRWLFGDCVPVKAEGSTPPVTTPPTTKRNKKQKDASKPFLYKWKEASDPSQVPVPSLNVKIIGGDEEEEEDDDAEEPEPTPLTLAVTDPSPPAQTTALDKDSNKAQQSSGDDGKSETKPAAATEETVKRAETKVQGQSDGATTPAEASAKTESTKPAPPPAITPAAPMDPKTPTPSSDGKMQIDKKDDKVPLTKPEAKTTTEPAKTEATSTSQVEDNEKKTHQERVDKEKNSETLPVTEKSKESVDKAVPADKIDVAKKEEEKPMETKTDASTSTLTETITPMEIEPNDSSTPAKPKPEEPPKVMFASIMPKFLDASDRYKDSNQKAICPSSGQWKGYFENVIPGKKTGRSKTPPKIQKIDEAFTLFLNATPTTKETPEPSDNPSVELFAFATATKDHIPNTKSDEVKIDGAKLAAENTDATSGTSSEKDKKTKQTFLLVQVRGWGENEFGTFEIMGYLDLNTMVMEIQRQYVVTEINAVSTPAATRRRRSSATAGFNQEGTRSHSTRKRNPTWKRASYDPEEDRRRKRTRPGQKHGSPVSIDPATGNLIPAVDANGVPFPGSIPFALNPEGASSGVLLGKFDANSGAIPMSTVSGSSIRGQNSRLVLPTQSKGVDSTGRRRSSSTGGVRTKRRSSSMGKSATTPTKSGSTHIRLPAVGDAKKARWRAAHFLYYQRDDPERRALELQQQQERQQQQQQQQQGTTPTPTNGTISNAKLPPPKPKYVIYEGEMVDSKREGRGICLFTDGTLYEGEWKRNKEHGYGKLMSSDRKQIIYEGEWERGRMQGNGTYYYGSSDPLKPGSRYVGEFRENLRNGIGRYFLADGSVYDGQWRDGVMNGLGVFTWPDHSMYDGVWKDGKRNGQGLLKKADGFIYDGQWVNNTMDGRGIAIYPNGQKYEGSFSNGRREGRGTIVFTNGAVYEGRFRDDAVDGQGTMKMSRTMIVPREEMENKIMKKETKEGEAAEAKKEDFMIPISFQSDMTRILTKTGFM